MTNNQQHVIRREGDTIIVQGPVTIHNVVALTQQGIELIDQNHIQVDLKEVTEVDSVVICMLFEWLRVAHQQNGQLQFLHLPENLRSLVQLYSVTDIIFPEYAKNRNEIKPL